MIGRRFGLIFVFSAILFGLVSNFTIQAQPPTIVISSLSQTSAGPGALILVIGGPFGPTTGSSPALVYVNSIAATTEYESSTALAFVVPPNAPCGSVSIRVKATAIVPGVGEVTVESNPRSLTVDCTNATRAIKAAVPQIDSVSPTSNVSPGQVLTIEGDHLLPYPGLGNLPMTRIEFRKPGTTASSPADFIRFGRVRYEVPEGIECGSYTIQAQNYVYSGQDPRLSNTKQVLVTENCDAPEPPVPTGIPWSVNSLDPDRGEPGTRVSILGSGFPNAVEVKFSGQSVRLEGLGGTLRRISDIKLDFVIPADAECGDNDVLVGSSDFPGQFSDSITFVVIGAPCQGNGVGQPNVVIRNLNIPRTVEAGEEFNIGFELANIGDATSPVFDVNVSSGNNEIFKVQDVILGAGQDISFNPPYRFGNAGEYEIRIDIESRSEEVDISVVNTGVAPPPPVNGGNLKDYDLDDNCVLSDPEFFNLIDAWISELVENLLFFSGVDAWIGQTDICASTSSSSILLRSTAKGVEFSGSSRKPLDGIQIFDLQGNMIHVIKSNGVKRFWNLRNSQGELVANGIYFARFGSANEIRKFAIIR